MLERNGMVVPQAQRHKCKYKPWQRETPMALWQPDLVGGIYLADGRECKMLSGIDDHSRFVVCAAVLAVPSGEDRRHRQRLRVCATYAEEDRHRPRRGHTFRVTCDGVEVSLHPRNEQRPVNRWKAKILAPKPEPASSMF